MQQNGKGVYRSKFRLLPSAYKNQTFSIDESRTELVRAMPRQEKVHPMNVFDSREQSRIYSGYAEARKGACNERFRQPRAEPNLFGLCRSEKRCMNINNATIR